MNLFTSAKVSIVTKMKLKGLSKAPIATLLEMTRSQSGLDLLIKAGVNNVICCHISKVVRLYKYLGLHITSDGSMDDIKY